MKRFIFLIAATLFSAFCFETLYFATNVKAEIINIDSKTNNESNPVQVFLETGTYRVIPIGTDDGGNFNAWNAWGSTNCSDPNGCDRATHIGWVNAYAVLSTNFIAVSINGVPVPITPGMTKYYVDDWYCYLSAISALDHSQYSEFTISTSGLVGFSNCDTYLADNIGGMSLSVDLVSIEAIIDIKPGSDPNCFNNDGHGVIPVAILGTPDFDVRDIDPGTIRLESLEIKAVGKNDNLLAHYEDVDSNGYEDLVVQIRDADGVFTEGDGTATLTGELYDGTPIEGNDSICVVQ